MTEQAGTPDGAEAMVGSEEFEPTTAEAAEPTPDDAEVVAEQDAVASQQPAGETPVASAQPDAGATVDGDAGRDLAAERLADLQRLQAEYVNYKRRVDRDRELVLENAKFSVLSSLLPVLDDLDRAREHGELEGGFKAVADALERIVASQGLVKFGAPGDEFDPRLHEALLHSYSPDVTTTSCQNIVTAGYKIGDRVVRPARVPVVDPVEDAEPQGGAGTGGTADADPAAGAGPDRPAA